MTTHYEVTYLNPFLHPQTKTFDTKRQAQEYIYGLVEHGNTVEKVWRIREDDASHDFLTVRNDAFSNIRGSTLRRSQT